MMDISTLFLAFIMGLTGSLHCAGMCGAIVWIMPFQVFNGYRKFAAIAIYHLARISIYAAMALILFAFRDVFKPQVQQFVSVSLGCILLIAGVVSFLPGRKMNISLPWVDHVKKGLGNVIGHPSLRKIAIAGALNGLLPCGLVYMALSATMTLKTAAMAVSFIYAFGLGTMPLLIGITLLKQRMDLKMIHIRKFVPVIVFLFGCLFVMRGLNLGIPYLSPKVEMVHQQIKHSCCHKK